MNFRRILLTGAALGSAAALTTACSNSDDVVLTIPTTDSAVSGNDAGPDSESGHNDSDDGRFIARCSTEADGDGFAGQTFFTDGSSDFSDYCLQRFYSGVQPAPGAVYVPREDREDSDRESGSNERSSDSERKSTQPQQVPTEGQVLAEGQNNRNQNISDGGVGGQPTTDQSRTRVGGEQNQATDNFGAANAGSPTRPGDGNQGGDNNNAGNHNQGNQGGNNDNPGRGDGDNDGNDGQGGSQPPTTTPGRDNNADDNDTTTPGIPGVTLPPVTSPTTPETPRTTQPQTPETTGQGQTTPSTPQTGQQTGQTQAPSQTQSPEGTGSTQNPTPTETADTGAGTGAVEDTSSPSGALSGSSLPTFPQFPPLQAPAVGEIFNGISS